MTNNNSKPVTHVPAQYGAQWAAKAVETYTTNKAAKVNTTCNCPTCGTAFTKKSYQQAFCSGTGRGNCKDRYQNRVNDDRKARAIRHIVGEGY